MSETSVSPSAPYSSTVGCRAREVLDLVAYKWSLGALATATTGTSPCLTTRRRSAGGRPSGQRQGAGWGPCRAGR